MIIFRNDRKKLLFKAKLCHFFVRKRNSQNFFAKKMNILFAALQEGFVTGRYTAWGD